jgi:hypothetical protein
MPRSFNLNDRPEPLNDSSRRITLQKWMIRLCRLQKNQRFLSSRKNIL